MTNSIMRENYEGFEMYQALRPQLMESLRDDELLFTPGGENSTLGALCREIGEVEQAYIDSFKTFKADFSYRHPDPSIERSVSRLTAWFAELDAKLKEVVSSLPEEDVQNRIIDRGGGFVLPPRIHLFVYQEALLIFYGKASVYLKAMRKPRTEQWRGWIA
jgi:hypothetical protein